MRNRISHYVNLYDGFIEVLIALVEGDKVIKFSGLWKTQGDLHNYV